MTNSESAMLNLIHSRLIGSDSYFAPNGFETTFVLYWIKMRGSFLASLINGVQEVASFCTPDGCFRYNELIRQVAHVTGRENAFWFYVTNPDNCLSVVNWVHECNYQLALDVPLSSFETEPAVQGGISRLGLLGGRGRWLLLHEYRPEEEFRIDFYGSSVTCNELRRLLNCSDSECTAPDTHRKTDIGP